MQLAILHSLVQGSWNQLQLIFNSKIARGFLPLTWI